MSVTKTRSFVKAITWRATGTADTFLIALIILNEISAMTFEPLLQGYKAVGLETGDVKV